MKKIISLILASVMCFSLITTTIQAEEIENNNALLTETEDYEINSKYKFLEDFDDGEVFSEEVEYEDVTSDKETDINFTEGVDYAVGQEGVEGAVLVVERNGWKYYLDRSTGTFYRENSMTKEDLFEDYYVSNAVYDDYIITVIMFDSDYNAITADITAQDEIIYDEEIELFSESNETKIFNYCINEMGLNVAAACAVLANIKAESSFNPNLYGDKGTSYGICQWHDPDRFTKLKKYCKKHNCSWKSLDGQLKYLKYELSNGYTGVWNKLKKAKNSAVGAREAAKYWCAKFERPAGAGTPSNYGSTSIYRGNLAENTYWAKYKNYTNNSKTEDNLVYPTKKVKFSSWVEDGCVHDISVSVGTPVYAIADGTVTYSQKYAVINGKKKLVSYGNLIEFVSTDKTVKAKYAHLNKFSKCELYISSGNTAQKSQSELKKQNISIKTKKLGSYKVSQGEIIGYSGQTGNASGPHLHFELRVNGKRVNPTKYLSTDSDDDHEETKYKKSSTYPTPLKCYTISKAHVTTYYGSISSNKTGWIDGNKDECTVKEIYTNGFAKVTYSGVKGFAYVPLSAIIDNPVSAYSSKVGSKQTIYKRSDLMDSYGSINSSTKIKVVGEKGNKVQIIVPSGKNYKLAWISKSKLEKNKTDDIITVNTSNLKTPITTYTIKKDKIPTYTKMNGKSDGYIDGKNDVCVIKEICNNGWVKVSYPVSNKKNKTAYAKASAFADDLYTSQSTQAKKNQTVYRREDLKDSIGEVYKNDTVQVVDISGDKVQIVYPIKGGYKMGWMKANNLKPIVSSIRTVKPDTLRVVQNQTLNTGLITVIAEYIDGSEKTLTYNTGLMDDNDESSEYGILDSEYDEVGEQTLTLSHTENGITVYDEIDIEVIPPAMTGLQITSMPYKTNYIEGEEFVSDGLAVQALYENNTSETITDYDLDIDDLVVGDNKVTVSVDDAETTFNITVVPKSVVSIEPKIYPSKTSYVEGQSFDPDGLTLLVKYNNGTEEEITEGFDCSSLDSYSIGDQNITVTYEGKTTTIPVTVIQKQPTGISIETPPDNTDVLEGSLSVDTTGMQIKVDYNDGTSGIIQGGYNVTGYEPRTIGSQTLVVNYCGFEANLDINVIAKTLDRLEIEEPAEVTEFIEGEELDTTGLEIYGYYNNGDVDEIYDYEISGFTSTVGVNTVEIAYDDLTVSYDVNVAAKQMVGLEITSEPDKTEYLEDETLDTTGLEVSSVYDNGEKIAVPLADCIIDGYDNTPGKKSISITYNDFTAIVDVEVQAMVLSSLTLDTKPTKETYNVGEDLDLSGISMTATYEHGKVEGVNIDDCVISGFDKDKAGVQTVVVTYRDLSVCFVVNVKEIVDRTAILKAGNASAIKGSTITVPVNIVNNTGISQFAFEVTYDKSAFAEFNVASSSMLSNRNVSNEIVNESDDFVTRKISWTGNEDVTSNGTALNMYLKVSETAESNSYPIEIAYDEESTKNKAGENVKLTCMHGTVIVEEGDVITRVVSGDQTSIVAGGVLNYDISLTNNTGISAYKLNVTYDKSVMKLVNVTNGRLFGDFDIDYVDNDGVVTVTGISTDINRQNGTLFRFEFTTEEEAENGNYPIAIEYVPEETYISENDNKSSVTLNTIDGEVAISGYVLGDINGDGRVNNFDVMTLVGYVNNNRNLDEQRLMAADITGDGVVDYLDYASLSAYIIGLYEELESDTETAGGSLHYKSNFVGGANTQRAVITADEIPEAQIGEYVPMNVELSRNPGMSGYVITLNYDVDDLELIDIEQKDALTDGKFNVNTSVTGEATVMWSDDSVHYEDGTIFAAVFKVKNADSEEMPVRLSYNSEHTGYIDEDLTSVAVSLLSEDGVIYPDISALYMTIDDVTKEGNTITGSVTVNNSDESWARTADLYIAAYDSAGVLLNIKMEDITFDGVAPITKEFTLQSENAKYIKTFVFEKGNIKPLMKAKTEQVR